jgi:hypothetical protein
VDVWKDTTLSDCDVTQKLVQFLIVSDGELQVTRDDTRFLVITSSVTGEFEDFGRKIFQHSSEVNWSTGTDTLSIVAFPQQTMNSANWESETSF